MVCLAVRHQPNLQGSGLQRTTALFAPHPAVHLTNKAVSNCLTIFINYYLSYLLKLLRCLFISCFQSLSPCCFTMDGLSGAASVVQVIQLSAQVLGALKTYYEVVRDCREDLARLYDAICGLKVILPKLKDLASDVNLESIRWCFNEDTGPMRRLHQELNSLEKKLASWKLDQITTEKKLRRATKYLKWPLLKSDIANSTRVIRYQCSIVTLELGLGSLSIQSQTLGTLDDLRNDIEGGLVSNHDSLAVVEAIKTDVAAGRTTQSEIVGIITKIDTTTAEKL